jgi:hypothetical protein
MKKTYRLLPILPIIAFLALASFAQASPAFTGQWKLDPSRSSALSFWNSLDLKISVDGNRVNMTRTLSYGDRSAGEFYKLDTTRADNVCPVEWWADNRYMALYIGGDGAKHIKATWLDDGRVLRLDSTFVVTTQQGEKTINILSDYKISPDGGELVLIETRSARTKPFVCVFKRVTK